MNEEEAKVRTGFWHIIRVKFDKTNGLIITLFIFLISYFTGNSTSIYLGIALFIGLVLSVLTWTFYRMADDLYFQNIALKRDKNQLSTIIQVKKLDVEKEEGLALFLLSPSELFSYNVLVTFYYYHRNYEQAIGFGEVVNIQSEDKIIQVILTYISKEHETLLEKLTQNNADCLKCTRVKPTFTKKYLTVLRDGGM